jgi:Zn-finger nucleic acid-binding protein
MELVESRRYFRCQHCGAFHFPESIEAGGIRIVGHLPDGPKCPVCATTMAHALLDESHPVQFCAKCRGVLLPRQTFAGVIAKRRAWATSPPAEPVPLDPEDLRRVLRCPRCGGRFDTHPNYGPGNVVIDNCVPCDLIWLDFGEMDVMVDAPGRDRGSRDVPRIDPAPLDPKSVEERDEGESPDPLSFLLDFVLGFGR